MVLVIELVCFFLLEMMEINFEEESKDEDVEDIENEDILLYLGLFENIILMFD